MHNQYAKEGVTCISVALRLTERDPEARSLQFLRDQKAGFRNFFLDEGFDLWQEKFDISGPPTIFVFDRDNHRAGKFDDYADVEKLVKELLKQPR